MCRCCWVRTATRLTEEVRKSTTGCTLLCEEGRPGVVCVQRQWVSGQIIDWGRRLEKFRDIKSECGTIWRTLTKTRLNDMTFLHIPM
jgi:hypothetical protein